MNWLKEIQDATSTDALIDTVNQYLLEKSEDFWSWIPAAARPPLIATEDELHHWHHQVVHELTAASHPNVRMQDLAVFFLRASVRAHQITLKDSLGGVSNQTDFSASPRQGRAGRRPAG